ncbi:MAG: hypothetical protein S4CHLAM45_14690 [Chlamydiales bacterium]|nr:hypothetical protein [Chlamydiales bacterium]MCH9620569.1 hypothetical protein [Chlamydiales bacterium]MCH9623559.1 hypothetical protein [Chlamydiales bacterium]
MPKIPTRARICCKGGERLFPGSHYVSTLVLKEGEWERKDYCLTCFKGEGEVHTWQGKIPPKEEKKLTPDEEAYARFSLLVEKEQRDEMVYLLALYLVRKKMLVKRGPTFYENIESGELFEIKPIQVQEDAKRELQAIFNT